MTIYIVTGLIENEDEGTEVNVLGVRKTLDEARKLLREDLEVTEETYLGNDISCKVNEVNEDSLSDADIKPLDVTVATSYVVSLSKDFTISYLPIVTLFSVTSLYKK